MEEPPNPEKEAYKSILRTRKKKKAICMRYIDAMVEYEKKRLANVKIEEKTKPNRVSLPQFVNDGYDNKEIERQIRTVAEEMAEIVHINRIIKKNYNETSVCYIPHTMVSLDGETI